MVTVNATRTSMMALVLAQVLTLASAWPASANSGLPHPAPTCAPKGIMAVEPGAPPTAEFWSEIEIPADPGCLQPVAGRVAVATAVDGAIRWSGDVRALAARIGAVSTTRGVTYWSTTAKDWRELVSDATALESDDAGTARADFSADEVLSGKPLYFAQNDTRSSGMNVYEMQVRAASETRLELSVENVSAIRLAFVTLYDPNSVRALQVFERTDGSVWRYRSISTIAPGNVPISAASLANRASAMIHALFETQEDPANPAMR